ncbi:MAG: type II toxin-antitoxin system YhaV family toxin [Gemmatimonadota bacterium]
MSNNIFERMKEPPPKASGWWLLSWPVFQRQLDGLVTEVERLRAGDSTGYRHHPKTKLLATLLRLITEEVPRDTGHEKYRQGNTLGPGYTSWYRAKFHQRYRLFYRFESKAKAIIYAWVNVEGGLRKAGDRNDPYAVFRKMLERGAPPTSFEQLTESGNLHQAGSRALIAGSEQHI